MSGWDGKCNAILKSVHNWRCSRKAVGSTGMCAQHRYFGATFPSRWSSAVNEHGVDVPIPHGPRFHAPGTAVARS